MKAIQFNVTIPQFLALKVFCQGNKKAFYSGPLAAMRMEIGRASCRERV